MRLSRHIAATNARNVVISERVVPVRAPRKDAAPALELASLALGSQDQSEAGPSQQPSQVLMSTGRDAYQLSQQDSALMQPIRLWPGLPASKQYVQDPFVAAAYSNCALQGATLCVRAESESS